MSAKKAKDDHPAFEDLLKVVEKKLEQLEGGELALEKSLEAYEEGVKALRQCYGILKQAEGKVEILTKTMGTPEVAEYDAETGAAKPAKQKTKERDDGKQLF
ncbi:MAG: exodeoxyribonuclease VII small subunit [Planctomycetaceae bacterium]|nr:exodeoxyribonuclease VII small subunit [Planctomycetaceae bacterium]